jgi:hypothetical protein
MSTEPLMWVVEWTEHYAHGTGSRKRNYTFHHAGTAQTFQQALIDGKHEGLAADLRSSLSDEDVATLTLKRAPFADRLEAWLKALRKNGIRSRKNVSRAALSKMNPDAPTVFHTGYQGYAYEAWGDEVYRKNNSGHLVQILHFNHNNLTPRHYDILRTLLEAYGLPYGWDGTMSTNIQIITPDGEIVYHVCDFCEEVAQGAYSVDVDGLRMCNQCVEANE